jgi:hypothetical protein
LASVTTTPDRGVRAYGRARRAHPAPLALLGNTTLARQQRGPLMALVVLIPPTLLALTAATVGLAGR